MLFVFFFTPIERKRALDQQKLNKDEEEEEETEEKNDIRNDSLNWSFVDKSEERIKKINISYYFFFRIFEQKIESIEWINRSEKKINK